MREHDDARVLRLQREVGLEPRELLLADARRGIGNVVDGNEMHALVIEAVEARPEEFLPRLAVVERRIVLAGYEAHVPVLQPGYDVAESREPAPALGRIVGRMREIAREDRKST